MKKFVLVDGHSILYRAYHALPMLTNKDDKPINAVYGFVSMTLKTLNELNPDYIAFVFDRPGGTFRNELYDKYQANRKKPDDDFIVQIGATYELLEISGFSIFYKDGYEADDVIGTLAKRVTEMTNDKVETIIVTSDRDQLQLVNDRVKLCMPGGSLGKTKIYGESETRERIGVGPDLIADFKGLAGDPSDNIPGINGIGPKTASRLLNQYGSLEEVFNHIEKIEKTSVKEKLISGRDMAFLSKKLGTIVTDVDIDFDLEKCVVPDLIKPEVVEYFNTMGFKTLVKRLGRSGKTKVEERKSPPSHKAMEGKKEQLGLF